MSTTDVADLDLIAEPIARGVRLPLRAVRQTIELLDDGNTVPFITRYRKDRTGGLDEEQIVHIQQLMEKHRQLALRKETILKSIQSQGKLNEALEQQIATADSYKRLEDLYLPYKPKRRSLATTARQHGLEPLADAILQASAATGETLPLDSLAAAFVGPETRVLTAEDACAGARYILAERFSERADVRDRLRQVIWQTGRLCAKRHEGETPRPATTPSAPPNEIGHEVTANPGHEVTANPGPIEQAEESTPHELPPIQELAATTSDAAPVATPDDQATLAPMTDAPQPAPAVASKGNKKASNASVAEQRRQLRHSLRQRKREKLNREFKDFFDYSEALRRIPHHRLLAINRGDRLRVLRVKIEADEEQMLRESLALLVPTEHPYAEYLQECVRDALTRLIFPSLEREIRRDMTDGAEEHAVRVFARTLRKLLLQPPVRGQSVMVIDPGLRNGCKLAAIDPFGKVLAHEIIGVVGNEEQRLAGRQRLVELIQQHALRIIAIGNGTGCREAEQLVADILEAELKDQDVSYVIVNEAGASVYSTSTLGRDELPDYDATIRGAISIGRRLLDPLSELVKINPSNIGVGLYQHDIKSKPLRESLDEVVRSCVNFVGVNLNTASPALLEYVSGLNQLTARRIYDHRQQHGPFRDRDQLKEVPGIGQATFVQSAGFLHILDGDNPLDATWIHPESYTQAQQLLAHLGCDVSELATALRQGHATTSRDAAPQPNGAATVPHETTTQGTEETQETQEKTSQENAARLADRIAQVDSEALARELELGSLLVRDMLAALARPGRDPRDDQPPPLMRRGVIKLENLQPGMEFSGTVLNVVDFGAFVDIGLGESGLVHISRLADQYVRDPHDLVSVGDVLRVWVVQIDKQRRRVSLTAIPPGSEKPRPARREPHRAAPAATATPAGRAPAGNRRRFEPRRDERPQRPRRQSSAPPKPQVPITPAMEAGREPMRTFGDLKQFFEKKSHSPPKPAED